MSSDIIVEKGFVMKSVMYSAICVVILVCMHMGVSAKCIHNDEKKHVKTTVKICMTKSNYTNAKMQNRMYKGGKCAKCGCSASDHKIGRAHV